MKTNKNLSIALLILIVSLCATNINAQCKKAFYNAEVQYNNGQFERAQSLLDVCIKQFKGNKSHYQNESELVKKVYELYINSCNKGRNTECAKRKRKELNDFLAI